MALRRLSPRVIVELLSSSGKHVQGPNVAWAGSGPMPMWLHLAREYTERWVHQMQIRQAVGAPDLAEKRLFYPVLNTFVRALPVAFAHVSAPVGTHVAIEVTGNAGGLWSLIRGKGEWALWEDVESQPVGRGQLNQDIAWRLWTKGVDREFAKSRFIVQGDAQLCEPILDAVAMIV